jgi:serine/threonine protein kinase
LSARYERGELHARGKLGQIWSARDIALNREVALKVVAEQSRDSEAARQRLLREARIGGRLEHPFIVPVYDVAEGDDGAPFYSMRMLRGPTLADQIARHHRERSSGRLDPLERRRLLDNFKDVCLAVAYAHKQGVLHLDLKPQNVVLGEYGEVYLLDWGLSREVPILGESTSNGSGTTKFTAEAPNTSNPEGRFGTPAYMSPEQAAGRPDRCDERTDVWGLGAILYELLTGKPPHSDEGIQDNSFFERIQTEPRRLPAEIGGGSLNPLSQLCMSALSIDPTMRIPSAEDMAMAVERWIDEEPMQPYRANIVTFESRLTEDPDHPAVNEGLARELFVLALVEGGLCRFSAACLTMARAESIYQGLCERFPADRRLRSALAISRMHFARLMERAGESERAEAMKRKLDSEIESLQQEALADDDRELSIVMTYFGLPIKPAEKPTSQERSKTDAADHTPSPLPPAQTVNIPDSILTGSPTSRFDKVRSISPHDIPLARDSVSDIVSPVTIVGPISPPGSSRVLPENDFLAREYYGGRFRAIKLIGTGGSSEVFLAHDGECQRHVAIKRLRRGIENDRLVRMLVEEGKIVAGLAHPGIPAVYSLGFDSEGAPFYAMSYCAGRDLAHLLSSQGPRSPTGTSVEKSQWVNWYNSGIKDALRVLIRACATIEHAHRNGVIHRDIKPSNIMWDRKSDQVVVIDWGLALLRDDSSPYGEHNSGDIIGTLGYMSPEQAKGCIDGIDPRSDIYSVGVILYETLAIRRPILFSHSSKILELLRLVIEGTYDPLNQTAPYAPPALRHICERAMQLSPERRYSSIADFARDIENWLEGRPVSVYREGLWRRAVRWATSWRCR